MAEEKGFPDWETWRRKFLAKLEEATEPEWLLEPVENPLEQVPHWFGGPFSGWINLVYKGQPTMSFAEIIAQPFMEGHDYIPGLVEHFPKLTILSVVDDANGRTFVVEGMHRACALTVMSQSAKPHAGLVFVARGKLKPNTELSFNIES